MIILLFIVHVLIALALIGVVMLQKSEGGALGMGGGGMSGFMTGRSTANLLTRTTAILGAAFFATSILLVLLSQSNRAPRSIIDQGGPVPTTPLMPQSAVRSGCARRPRDRHRRARAGNSRASRAERPVGAVILGALIDRNNRLLSREPGSGPGRRTACLGRAGCFL